MANLYNNASSNYYAPQEPDEISLFLQQILLRSSSSSSPHSFSRQQSLLPTPEHVAPQQQPPEMVGQISASEPLSGLKSRYIRSFAAAENVSPNSAANLENETDDCDYESEEVVEAMVSETAARSVPPRCSSKRSRAAEVHNLSEKRRRSRINEKMKALQNLIPNSNKTDKASMLDEAIEYLKQLQLQVQMLTMRNGLSLYPVCLPNPNQVSQTRVDACDTDKYLNEHVSDFSRMISKNSVDVESSMMQHHFGAFQLSRSFKKKEKVLPCLPLVEDGLQLQGCSAGGKETTSRLKDDSCVAGAAADLLQIYDMETSTRDL